jgi:hypothetical protein
MSYEVVYVHICQGLQTIQTDGRITDGAKRIHIWSYNDEKHEAEHIQQAIRGETQPPSWCRFCRDHMTKLGTAVQIRKDGIGADWLDYSSDIAVNNEGKPLAVNP